MPKKIITAFLFFLFTLPAFSQEPVDKDALQKQRDQLRKDIAKTEQELIETQKTTKANIGQLSLINRKLNLQGNVVDNISGEIRSLSDNIYLSQLEINKIRRILDTLKVEYAKSMVYAYKNSNNYDFINFIFSANSFNDAIKRIAYLKSYRTYREMQAENIIKTQAILEDKIAELSGAKKTKAEVLKEKDKELTKLQKQQQEKATIVSQLKGRQKELLAQVKEKRRQDAKIKNAITAMIRREIEIARAEAAKKEKERLAELKKNKPESNINPSENNTTSKTTKPASTARNIGSVLVSSEADIALNASFEKNKGSLPWPADGFVISHFGPNQYPGGIDYNNPGVSIGTKAGAPVKAVFDGEVTLVSYIDDKQAVFIKHGKYFTVYSNLASANVKRGDKVSTGQVIGKSGVNDEGQGEVDFILMKENDNVNPESWLRH
ncbi:MAG TPA: peptidoglycan DD-metalloendopeptidase family protein [Hanamia sp.]|nr:peptidoglycan DD-metalloendopeptidase family protein [Hanamia sp.]